MTSHYRTLGVDPGADQAVIRGAYLALIRRYHPDGGGADADAAQAQAVTAAWDVLRDPQRRAAYDETRQARFQPEGSGVIGPAVISREPRVRGGTAGRNLFLLLAAGTVGLGWWALQQPRPMSPIQVASTSPRPVAGEPDVSEVATTPAEQANLGDETEREQALPLPVVSREPDVDVEVVLPPLPVGKSTPMPARTPPPQRSASAAQMVQVVQPPLSRPQAAERGEKVPAPADAPRIDLAPLERHLQLLTDQSLRFGTEAKRARVFASREGFLARLRECDSDSCKRDAYLRRNAEIGDIMRN